MLYILAGLVTGLYATMVISFWCDVRRFGKWEETLGSDPHLFAIDGVSVFAAVMVAYWGAHDWFGFHLPMFGTEQLASWQATLLAILCAAASLALGYCNGRERFTVPTYSGRREATLRFLAARKIVSAAEVAAQLRKVRK